MGDGLKPKDLCGIPWRVALAMQADGWYLRSDIIWSKPNPMPESVTDRVTKSHEYLFLFSKQPKYFYDAEAVKEKQTESTLQRAAYGWHGCTDDKSNGARTGSTFKRMAETGEPIGTIPANGTRNRRSVWHIATAPYSGAHFATYPPKLVEPCIKAGTSERGACPQCGKQWVRETEHEYIKNRPSAGNDPRSRSEDKQALGSLGGHHGWKGNNMLKDVTTLGFRPDCECGLEPVPSIVFDPFAGSGTTLLVARKLGRYGIGLDLSLDYLQTCVRPRLSLDALDEFEKGRKAEGNYSDLPLFMAENPNQFGSGNEQA